MMDLKSIWTEMEV